MCVAPEPAVAMGQRGEIQMCKGVGACAAAWDRKMLKHSGAYQVGRPAPRLPGAEVDARLAEMDRQELRVDISDVQQRKVAESRNIVELGSALRVARARSQRRARRSGEREEPEEIPSP